MPDEATLQPKWRVLPLSSLSKDTPGVYILRKKGEGDEVPFKCGQSRRRRRRVKQQNERFALSVFHLDEAKHRIRKELVKIIKEAQCPALNYHEDKEDMKEQDIILSVAECFVCCTLENFKYRPIAEQLVACPKDRVLASVHPLKRHKEEHVKFFRQEDKFLFVGS